MRTDPITLQILRNHTRAAAESMATTLYRTAHSTFVKETEDFTIQILDAHGKSCAVPIDLGATWYPGLDYEAALGLVPGGYQPGDIAMTNDPYSGFLATHSPDIVMWKPIFHDNEIIAYAGGHIHNVDVGGAVPASLSRALTDVHQEGVRVPPCKLYRAGALDEGLIRMLLANVRVPDQNWGDMKALVAAVNTGERRVLDLVRRFGRRIVEDGLADLLDYAEGQARQVLASVADGTYRFVEYCDEDGVDGDPLRLCLTLRIEGDHATLDFAGTDPQTLSSLNVPTGGHPRHSLLLVGRLLRALRAPPGHHAQFRHLPRIHLPGSGGQRTAPAIPGSGRHAEPDLRAAAQPGVRGVRHGRARPDACCPGGRHIHYQHGGGRSTLGQTHDHRHRARRGRRRRHAASRWHRWRGG